MMTLLQNEDTILKYFEANIVLNDVGVLRQRRYETDELGLSEGRGQRIPQR